VITFFFFLKSIEPIDILNLEFGHSHATSADPPKDLIFYLKSRNKKWTMESETVEEKYAWLSAINLSIHSEIENK
jgi:hypothetical protein